MSTAYYRATVMGCAISWLMLGLHLPALHALTHPGQTIAWTVLSLTALNGIVAIACLWVLLRAPASASRVPDGR